MLVVIQNIYSFVPGLACRCLAVLSLFCIALVPGLAFSATPVATDTRIKTFIYNETEVFPLVVHYGYKPNIEFARGEEVEVVSIGKSYAWNFTTEGRRLFIEALEPDSHTNMTVITNRRTYQFDLESRQPLNEPDDDLVYVARFFYPEKGFDAPKQKVDSRRFLNQLPKVKDAGFNFEYSYTGADQFAPIKIFDDGRSTYFQFQNNNAMVPHIFELLPGGNEQRMSFKREDEFIVVDRVVKQFTLRLGGALVCIFNEG